MDEQINQTKLKIEYFKTDKYLELNFWISE